MNYEVRFITKHWEHHSTHSGYDQLVGPLGSAVTPISSNSLRDKWIPGRIAVWLAKNSGNKLYSYLHFYHEWATMREMFTQHPLTVYHVLYGDDSFRYLASLGKPKNSYIVASYHLPPAALSEYLTLPKYLRKLDGLIVVGRNQIPYFESLVRSDQIYFVPHGVHTSIFSPGTALDGKDNDGICLFVGAHRRDFVTLRQVIEIVNRLSSEVRFIIVTTEDKFKLFDGLKNVDLRCGVSESELVNLYRKADLLIQPLEDSTANNSVLEGLACGLPLVITGIGAVRDYVDERHAILVPPRNAKRMADSVIDLLSDERKRNKMSIEARRHALQFDWSVIAQKMDQVYQQVLG